MLREREAKPKLPNRNLQFFKWNQTKGIAQRSGRELRKNESMVDFLKRGSDYAVVEVSGRLCRRWNLVKL